MASGYRRMDTCGVVGNSNKVNGNNQQFLSVLMVESLWVESAADDDQTLESIGCHCQYWGCVWIYDKHIAGAG